MTLSFRIAHARRVVVTATILALAGLFGAGTALARISRNTIDPIATVSAQGRQLTLTGPIEVTAGETVYLQVTVTQRSTGAVAEGIAFLTGTGVARQWEIQASAHTRESFEAGAATAVGLARSTARGAATDAHQWLVDVTLVRD